MHHSVDIHEYILTFIVQVCCDVQFTVGSDSITVEQIGAHKYILIARSPVFYAMFCGDLAEASSEPVRVPDIEPLAFRQMLT